MKKVLDYPALLGVIELGDSSVNFAGGLMTSKIIGPFILTFTNKKNTLIKKDNSFYNGWYIKQKGYLADEYFITILLIGISLTIYGQKPNQWKV